MLTSGSKIGGFLIGDLLGKGAMGEVYRGEQLSLKRPVAIKRIATHLLENEDMVRRFKREAQVLAKVGHPNVVGVVECEEFPDETGAKHLLLIMELIEGGRSLKTHLGKPIDWRLATTVVRMCADGLAAAYDQHVVHRDIKPDNIMLTGKGIAKLVDFGLAKAAESTALTMQAAPMGTPLFMSPEACRGEEIGHAGDIYSLGVSWWYMLVGKYPFEAANLHGLLYKHISEALPSPTGLFDNVPAPIVKLVYQCLEKDAANRPASAIKLVEAIESLPAQGLLLPRDARELIGAGHGSTSPGGATTKATMVAGPVNRSAATIIGGSATSKAQEATAPTAVPNNPAMTVTGDLSPRGAVAATVVANLGPQGPPSAVAATVPTPAPVKKPASSGGLIAGVVVAVLVLGGAGAWFATRSSDAPVAVKPGPKPVEQPKPEPVKPVVAVVPEPPKPVDLPKAEPPKSVVAIVETPKSEPPKPVEQPKPEPPKPVVAAVETPKSETPKPVETPKPLETPKAEPPRPVDTSAFNTALAAKDWKAAKSAADALPEAARGDANLKLSKAANAQLIATMKAAKTLFDSEKFLEASTLLAAEVAVAPYADKAVREKFIQLAKLVRDTAKQAQENP